ARVGSSGPAGSRRPRRRVTGHRGAPRVRGHGAPGSRAERHVLSRHAWHPFVLQYGDDGAPVHETAWDNLERRKGVCNEVRQQDTRPGWTVTEASERREAGPAQSETGSWRRMAMGNTRVHRRLEGFYGELTSVDAILRARARDGQEAGTVTAADLYTRSLDCQNLGGFVLLERHAALAAEYSALEGQRVLDAGCGLGGPGRYLADRGGGAVIGVDVLPAGAEGAAAPPPLAGRGDRAASGPARTTRPPSAPPQLAAG